MFSKRYLSDYIGIHSRWRALRNLPPIEIRVEVRWAEDKGRQESEASVVENGERVEEEEV